MEPLEKASDFLFQWLSDNYLRANVLVSRGTAQIQNSSSKKLLRIKIDYTKKPLPN